MTLSHLGSFENLLDEALLGALNVSVVKTAELDPKKLLKTSFSSQRETLTREILNKLVNEFEGRSSNFQVIDIHNNQHVVLPEKTRIMLRLDESSLKETLKEMLIPEYWCNSESI